MKIVSEYSQVRDHHQEAPVEYVWSTGPIFQMLLCPACDMVSVARIMYHDGFDPSDWRTEILYPAADKTFDGLPHVIANAYEAALKVRSIDPNLFAVGLRRVLELVCKDRTANGRTLHEKLNDLAKRNEIPQQLADMAHGLRKLGNIGAHASEVELTSVEIPFLDKLCVAVLEYVYLGPRLLEEVQGRLQEIQKS